MLASVCVLCSLQFLAPQCEQEINIDAASKASLLARITSGDVPADTFDRLLAIIEKELAGDVMPRFVSSKYWKDLPNGASTPAHQQLPQPVKPAVQIVAATASPTRSHSAEKALYGQRLFDVSLRVVRMHCYLLNTTSLEYLSSFKSWLG